MKKKAKSPALIFKNNVSDHRCKMLQICISHFMTCVSCHGNGNTHTVNSVWAEIWTIRGALTSITKTRVCKNGMTQPWNQQFVCWGELFMYMMMLTAIYCFTGINLLFGSSFNRASFSEKEDMLFVSPSLDVYYLK